MTQIYTSSDAQIFLPYYAAGVNFGEGSTVSLLFFTINRDNNYTITISGNPAPVYVNLAGSNLRYMESGVLRCIITISGPDENFPDATYDRSSIFVTDYYFKKSFQEQALDNYYTKTQIDASFYNKSETQQIIDDLEATIANEYIDTIDLSEYVGQETYSKEYIDSSLNRRAKVTGDVNTTFNVSTLQFPSGYNFRVNNSTNELEIYHHGIGRVMFKLPYAVDKTHYIALDSDLANYYNKTYIDNTYYTKSHIDSSLSNFVNEADIYSKEYIDGSLNRRAYDTGDTNKDFNAKKFLLSNNYSILIDTADSKSLAFKHTGIGSSITLPYGKGGTVALTSDIYTKEQLDTSINSKADSSTVYSKSEIDSMLLNVPTGVASNMVTLTQTEYDNLSTVDASTYYFIIESNS